VSNEYIDREYVDDYRRTMGFVSALIRASAIVPSDQADCVFRRVLDNSHVLPLVHIE
jgi:hypothetical protein